MRSRRVIAIINPRGKEESKRSFGKAQWWKQTEPRANLFRRGGSSVFWQIMAPLRKAKTIEKNVCVSTVSRGAIRLGTYRQFKTRIWGGGTRDPTYDRRRNWEEKEKIKVGVNGTTHRV